jgi:hypothetical protein
VFWVRTGLTYKFSATPAPLREKKTINSRQGAKSTKVF